MSAIVKEVYDAFRSAGVSDEQSTAAAQSIPIATSLATKADISDIHVEIGEVRAEIGEVRAEINAVRAELGAEIGSVRAEIGEVRAEINAVRAELGAELGAVRAEMKQLELRMTIKLYSALGVAVAGVKALDFLIG